MNSTRTEMRSASGRGGKYPAANRIPLVPALFLLSALAALPAQNPQSTQPPRADQQDVPVFRVQSGLVVADVTVRDKAGKPVEDLRKEDFVLYEDGIPQEVVLFSLEKIPGSGQIGAPRMEPSVRPAIVNLQDVPIAQVRKEQIEDKRLVVLFFDLSSLGTEDLIRSVDSARRFVTTREAGHDLVAVVTYDSALHLVQDLTNDRTVLLDVLERIQPNDAGDQPVEDLGDPDTSDEVFVPDDIQFNIFNTDRRLSAIETVARMYREFPERKSLLYFSSGVTTTGIENQSQIRSTVDAANQSNMSIYSVDSRGLVALPPGGDATRGSAGGRAMFSGDAVRRQTADFSAGQETLTTLAHDTGGAEFQDTNDLGPVFDRVIADSSVYYVLGYYSSNKKEDGKFRRLKIEVRRPGLDVLHRPGYFAAKQFSQLTRSERDRQLEVALDVDRPFSEVPFILQADYFRSDGPNSLMPLTIQLAGDGVRFEEKGSRREAQFEFLARITDRNGKVAGVARDTVDVRLPVSKAEKIQAGQIIYSTGFQLRPGDYSLKFLVRDNRTGRLGSFEQALAVPDLSSKKFEISSVVLGSRLVPAETSPGIEHRGIGRKFEMLGIRRDPLQIENRRIVPSIGNVFLSRQTAYVYFQVYGAATDPRTHRPAVEAALMMLEKGSKMLESRPQIFDAWTDGEKGTVSVTMALPLNGLQKGSYALQIHVRDLVSDTNLFRREPLVIE